MKTIKHDGRTMRLCPKYGWREGNPSRDVDSHGLAVDDKYFVIVEVSKCRIVEQQDGKTIYNSEGVSQAFALSYGGTCYGYRTITRHARVPIQFRDKGGEWVLVDKGQAYEEISKYVIQDGRVYSTSWKKIPAPVKEMAKIVI